MCKDKKPGCNFSLPVCGAKKHECRYFGAFWERVARILVFTPRGKANLIVSLAFFHRIFYVLDPGRKLYLFWIMRENSILVGACSRSRLRLPAHRNRLRSSFNFRFYKVICKKRFRRHRATVFSRWSKTRRYGRKSIWAPPKYFFVLIRTYALSRRGAKAPLLVDSEAKASLS